MFETFIYWFRYFEQKCLKLDLSKLNRNQLKKICKKESTLFSKVFISKQRIYNMYDVFVTI